MKIKSLLALLFILPLLLGMSSPESPLDAQIGQMIMVGFHGTNINDSDLNELKEQIKNGAINGVMFLGYNIENKEQTKKLIKDLSSLNHGLPLFFAIDQEGGKVTRLTKEKGFKEFPSAAEIARTKTPKQAYYIYISMARQLKELGFNFNFAPVVDLDINPNSPAIGKLGRSFGKSPWKVIQYATQFINAHHKANMLTSLKHYPGHGSAKDDSHLGVTDVTNTWQKQELEPYSWLTKALIVDSIMSSHIFNSKVDPKYPASLSYQHIQENLRNKLWYNGAVITDDLQMAAIKKKYGLEETIIRAVNAGNDILLFANYFELDKRIPWKAKKIIRKAVQEGKIKESRIKEASERVQKLKDKLLIGP